MRLLITGINRGIGASLAAEADRRGHEVVGTTRNGAHGSIKLELRDPAKIASQLDGKLSGMFDLVINNAGIIGPDAQSTLQMDWSGFAETLAVNTLAPLAVAQSVLPFMAEGGTILTVSSQMSWMGYGQSDRIAYRASKAAVNKVMQGLATDLEPRGIKVLLIDPGWVRTDMGGDAADEDPELVAEGILNIAAKAKLGDSGGFFRFTGERRAF